MVPKKDKQKQPEADADRWEYQSRDQMSAFIDKLRELPRHTPTDARPDGIYVLAVDLDAAIAASIEVPPPNLEKDSER